MTDRATYVPYRDDVIFRDESGNAIDGPHTRAADCGPVSKELMTAGPTQGLTRLGVGP